MIRRQQTKRTFLFKWLSLPERRAMTSDKKIAPVATGVVGTSMKGGNSLRAAAAYSMIWCMCFSRHTLFLTLLLLLFMYRVFSSALPLTFPRNGSRSTGLCIIIIIVIIIITLWSSSWMNSCNVFSISSTSSWSNYREGKMFHRLSSYCLPPLRYHHSTRQQIRMWSSHEPNSNRIDRADLGLFTHSQNLAEQSIASRSHPKFFWKEKIFFI